MTGLVLIDKPAGCTSHDVVNRWRKLANTKRVGHLGTLDPMATGLLVLLTGTATRLAQFFERDEKTYLAEITLGVTSDSYDADGHVVETRVAFPTDPAVIRLALERFRGPLLQMPPAISAKKIRGVPAYKLARRQVAIELKAVEVEVKELAIKVIGGSKVEAVITCTAGTYIRTLAHDFGQQLGCGAILSGLRRIRAGAFRIEDAWTLDELAKLAAGNRLEEAVTPSEQLLTHFPAEHFEAGVEAQIRQGRDFRTSPFVVPPGAPRVRALSRAGKLIAIGELKIPNFYHPGTVL